ncbi:MAG TPA: gas vesicle protein GvpO [Streptosporangiaceae bacterium]|nr:gas vesicle protein GvpO [Streptosporangiaceae bacterium]
MPQNSGGTRREKGQNGHVREADLADDGPGTAEGGARGRSYSTRSGRERDAGTRDAGTRDSGTRDARAREARAGGYGARDPRAADSGGAHDAASRERARRWPLAARQAAQRAARQVLELTGRQPENVISIAKDEEGWQVGVEVVEMHRIPDSADILAVYHVGLDARGELVACQRERRYHRGSTEGG